MVESVKKKRDNICLLHVAKEKKKFKNGYFRNLEFW